MWQAELRVKSRFSGEKKNLALKLTTINSLLLANGAKIAIDKHDLDV